MKTVKIDATKRDGQGKKNSSDMRAEGLVPCNLYGIGDNISFSVPAKVIRALIYSPEFRIAEISLDGATHRAIVKEVQMHPLTDEVRHLDFLVLQDGKKITVELPVKLVGASKGVREGGKLTQKIRRVKVKTTPDKLVPVYEVSIDNMSVGTTLRIADIARDGMELQHAQALPVASVFMPRVSKADEAAAKAAAADAKSAAAKAAPAKAAPAKAAPAAKK